MEPKVLNVLEFLLDVLEYSDSFDSGIFFIVF